MSSFNTRLTQRLSIRYPIIGGAMYPCTNPELVAAISEAGGVGVVQPISLTYVHKHDFRKGLRHIKLLTTKPFGLNLLIEQSSKKYLEKNKAWLDIALEEGVRFFITALGKPDWVVKRLEQVDGCTLFHDVTSQAWAKKAIDAGVDGLICVNDQAGGHAGGVSPQQLFDDLSGFGLPLVCAGGVGGRDKFNQALGIGYDGVQMGTRFIATKECVAHQDYKSAIVSAGTEDIVLTKKLTGVPVAVIQTEYLKNKGVNPGRFASWCLASARLKHFMRTVYSLRSIWQLRRSLQKGADYREYFQAGKSVAAIDEVLSVKEVFANIIGTPDEEA